jgi:predicted amidohydrolase YtcJ
LAGLSWKAAGADAAADLVIFGGAIVTVNDAQPTAEAIAVKDGKIIAVGAAAEIRGKWIGAGTRVVDLGGKTLLPGFIDGHGHFMNSPRISNWVNVSNVPAGPVTGIPDILKAFKQFVDERKVPKGEWVLGYGYDGSGLAEGREMTRLDLDSVLPAHPVMAIHVSNHGAVLNSLAMKTLDITAETKTPPAGVILREPGSEQPAGLLMETAFLPIFAKLPQPSEAELLDLLKPAQVIYASKGVTTAQEGATHADELVFLRKAAEQGRLMIDVVSLPFIAEVPKIFAEYLTVNTDGKPVAIGDPSLEFGKYKNRLKLGGVKFVNDGSVQGKTGFHTQPLLTGGPAGEKDYVGAPTFPREVIVDLYKKIAASGIQIWSHANGDAAIDIAIEGATAAGLKAGDDRRHVVIHSQCMRPDQLDSYAKLGLSPSFFVVHTFFWGDVHLANLGQERAFFISPMKSAQTKGIRFSNHNDFSITPLDPMRMIWSAVQRKSKSGVVIGPDERVDVMTAIKAITIAPAWHYREEASKGSIEVGKLADLVILDKNPLDVPVDEILTIKVVETFKEGKTIYAAGQKAGASEHRLAPWRFASSEPRVFVADDGGAPKPGCACCDGGLNGETREAALQSMRELATSEFFI